ncbi:MAG: hypothetical protein FWH08_06995 [Oscillospiraceae bacterium]|nr:hypothetical protein [Oscillospiraceae bacterium]
MRKIYLVLITVFALLICVSCYAGLGIGNLDLNQSYSFTVNMEYNGASSTAELTRTAMDRWEGALTAPYALQGVGIEYTPLEMSISYSGFTVRHELDSSGEFNIVVSFMFRAFEHAFKDSEEVNISSGRDFIEITGAIDGDVYILTLDKAGLPTSLEIPSRQFRAVFTEVTAERFVETPPTDITPEP